VHFHWADVGEGRTVSVTFTADGVPCSASAVFNVKDPTVEFPAGFDPPAIGTIKPFTAGGIDLIALVNATPTEINGTLFKATVTVPSGFNFGPGEWEFGQLTWETLLRKQEADGKCKQKDTEVYVNDNPWPFVGPVPTPGPPPWTGGTQASVVDSPAESVGGKTQIVWNPDEFIMYIMFIPDQDTPSGGSSAWVPLRACTWQAECCAEKKPGGWKVVSQVVSMSNWSVTRIHPVWSDCFTNFQLQEVDCPGPCQGGSSSSSSSSSSSGP
jgi:hypothetical protein